ncbi:MAG TPA: nucleoside monophosphate kinase [Candidatus Saccharimonadales bacterium]|nr:nucleoside monophosphate kinase [Candidatus Saccharimonadales bacterium]
MIILMGVAGAGKSMQGRLFADEHGYAWISTGELFRVLVTGQRRAQMLEGKLLSDDEVIALVDKTLKMIDVKQEFLLDGFPRTEPQADWLIEQVESGRLPLKAVFNLVASEEVVKKRLLERGRQDDTEAAIQKRFDEYRANTLPIMDHLKKAGAPVYDINADQDPIKVHDDMMSIIDGRASA